MLSRTPRLPPIRTDAKADRYETRPVAMAVDDFRGSAGLMAKNTRTMSGASGLAALLTVGPYRRCFLNRFEPAGSGRPPAVANDVGTIPDQTETGVPAPAPTDPGSNTSEPAPAIGGGCRSCRHDAADRLAERPPPAQSRRRWIVAAGFGRQSQLRADAGPALGFAGPAGAVKRATAANRRSRHDLFGRRIGHPPTGSGCRRDGGERLRWRCRLSGSAGAGSVAEFGALDFRTAASTLIPERNLNSSLAAGLSQVVTTEGGRIQWYDKTGHLQNDQIYQQFFQCL